MQKNLLALVLLALIMLSSLANAQFGREFGGQSPGPGQDFGPGFNFGSDPLAGFGLFDHTDASDVTGDVRTLITLRATNLLLSALPQGKNAFSEACETDEGAQELITNILENYNSNLSSLTEICDRYQERAQNFSEKICSPNFTDFPVPPHIKQAAQQAGISIGLSMTADDMKRICEIQIQSEDSKRSEFEKKRHRQEAERILDNCKQRKEFEEKMREQDEDNRKRMEEEMQRRFEHGREFDPFGQGQGGYPSSPFGGGPNNQFPGGSQQAFCGDGSCNGFEDQFSCPNDCGFPSQPPTDQQPPQQPPSQPFCGDGVCNEDPLSCTSDCGQPPQQPPAEPPPEEHPPEPPPEGGAQTASAIKSYSGIISLQDFPQSPDAGPFSSPQGPFGGPGFDSFNPQNPFGGQGFDDDFGPPHEPFDPGFNPGFGPSIDEGFDDFDEEFDDFGPGFGPQDFGQGPGIGPQKSGFGGGPDFGPPGFNQGPGWPDSGFGPGGPGFGFGGGFGDPFGGEDMCELTVDQIVEKLSEFSEGFKPDTSAFGSMCEQMAQVMSLKLEEMRLQKELHEESCKLKIRRQSLALNEAAEACNEVISGQSARELITDTVNGKCQLIKLRELRKEQLRNSLRAAVGIFEVAEELGSDSLESTALTIVNDAQRLEEEKSKLSFFDTLFGNADHAKKADSIAEEFKERREELQELVESVTDRASQNELEEQIEQLDEEIKVTEERASAYEGGIFSIFGRLGAQ